MAAMSPKRSRVARPIERLGGLTGADVTATTNLTGSRALGGDWNLECSTGAIEARLR